VTPFELGVKTRVDEFLVNLINERKKSKKWLTGGPNAHPQPPPTKYSEHENRYKTLVV
jgi:hypothetical protein